MSYSIYNVSSDSRVLSFTQNQQEPNKVGEELGSILLNAVKEGTAYVVVKKEIEQVHAKMMAENIRGITSIKLSFHESNDSSFQDSNIIYLSYKLNGTFITFTEYLPLKS